MTVWAIIILAFLVAWVLIGGPWRRAHNKHWTERDRWERGE